LLFTVEKGRVSKGHVNHVPYPAHRAALTQGVTEQFTSAVTTKNDHPFTGNRLHRRHCQQAFAIKPCRRNNVRDTATRKFALATAPDGRRLQRARPCAARLDRRHCRTRGIRADKNRDIKAVQPVGDGVQRRRIGRWQNFDRRKKHDARTGSNQRGAQALADRCDPPAAVDEVFSVAEGISKRRSTHSQQLIQKRLGLAETQGKGTAQQTHQGTELGPITGRFHISRQGGAGAGGAAGAQQAV
jgi:hypothetical protein